MDKRITNLEDHISPTYYSEDFSANYIKQAPNYICPYAEVTRIGGRSYVSKNLFDSSTPPAALSGGGTPIISVENIDRQSIRLKTLTAGTSSSFVSCSYRFSSSLFDLTKKYTFQVKRVIASSTNYPRVIIRAYKTNEDGTTTEIKHLVEKNSIRTSETSINLTINCPA